MMEMIVEKFKELLMVLPNFLGYLVEKCFTIFKELLMVIPNFLGYLVETCGSSFKESLMVLHKIWGNLVEKWNLSELHSWIMETGLPWMMNIGLPVIFGILILCLLLWILKTFCGCLVVICKTCCRCLLRFLQRCFGVCRRWCCCCGRASYKMMKAPGRNYTMRRSVFESNPRSYFQDLRSSSKRSLIGV